MRLEALPATTRDLFQYASGCEQLRPFTLRGGTALALQIGHRLSLDLDFAVFDEQLPSRNIQSWINQLRDAGLCATNITSPSAAASFRINTGQMLDNYVQDYEVAGVFAVMGLEGLKASKTLVLADRIRSRDLFDLMVLIRDYGLTIEQMATTVSMLGHNNDFERYMAAMTGELSLDIDDEGLSGPKVTTSHHKSW